MDNPFQPFSDTEVITFFHALHQIPELAEQEIRTSRYIADRLQEFGLEVYRGIGESHAVAGIMRGKALGPVLAIRADMDALPFVDKDGTPKAIHACGHDAHSAMVLAVAGRLIAEGGISRGEIRFVFQAAEESGLGAKQLLHSGMLNGVDGIIGIHLRSQQEAQLHEATPMLLHGSVASVRTRIIGEAAHAAQPHQGINAIDAAAAVVAAINAIHADPQIPHSVKVTSLKSMNVASNIIPSEVHMTVDIRAQNNEVMQQLLSKVYSAVRNGAACVGATAEIETPTMTAAAEPDSFLSELAEAAMTDVVDRVIPMIRTSGGEDFHFYRTEGHIPSAFIGLGCGMNSGLHKPDMSFNTAALRDGVQILYNFSKLFLKNDNVMRSNGQNKE